MVSQKATAICIYDILKTYSDENHLISTEKIRERLKSIYDVDMERRAVYRNIEALRSVGIEIEGYNDNREGYYLIDRELELSEVRLLCDAVAASGMIKESAGKQIIKKLIGTQSIFQGRLLQKTVFVKQDKAPQNKQVFYNIDALNVAINQGSKVRVRLFEYDHNHELQERKDSPVVISPYVTIWAEGAYYILAMRETEEKLEHFRIDLIKDIIILDQGVDMIFGGLNPDQYAKKFIYQKGEDLERYEIRCSGELWQELVERFGTEAVVTVKGMREITVRIHTTPSEMKAWVLQHVNECEVMGPKRFRDEIQRTVMEAYRKYWG